MGKVSLDPYLFFKGNAKEALEFYQKIFGGQVEAMGVDDFPGDFEGKDQMKGMVMHGWLKDADVMLMVSDGPNASPETKKVELCLGGDDETKLRGYWDGLVEGGKVRMPLEKAPWGDTFGGLTDKFGVDWIVNIRKQGVQNG